MKSNEFRDMFVVSETFFAGSEVSQVVSANMQSYIRKPDNAQIDFGNLQVIGVSSFITCKYDVALKVMDMLADGKKVYAEYVNIFTDKGRSKPKLVALHYVE